MMLWSCGDLGLWDKCEAKYLNVHDTNNHKIKGSWCHGIAVVTTAQCSDRFCTGSDLAHVLLKICNRENLWQWFWLEIRLNAFCRSTITQKKIFLIIIIISHQTLQGGGLPSARLFTTKHDRLVNCSGKPLKGTLKRLFYQVLLWGHVRNENWYIFSSLDLWPIKLENWF